MEKKKIGIVVPKFVGSMVGRIGRLDRNTSFLSSSLTSNPPNLGMVLSNLAKYNLNLTQKKTVFAMLELKATYPNELRQLYKQDKQLFKFAIQSLVERGLVKEMKDKHFIEIKLNYLLRKLKTVPKQKVNQIKFFCLSAPAKHFFLEFRKELIAELGGLVNEVLREARAFNIVLRQVEKDKGTEPKAKKSKNAVAEEKLRLGILVDNLIFEHKDDFNAVKVGLQRLIYKHPTQKAFFVGQIDRLELIHSGAYRDHTWEMRVESAKRKLIYCTEREK